MSVALVRVPRFIYGTFTFAVGKIIEKVVTHTTNILLQNTNYQSGRILQSSHTRHGTQHGQGHSIPPCSPLHGVPAKCAATAGSTNYS